MNDTEIEKVYSKIEELKLAVVNAKGLTTEKEERMRKCIRSMLDIIDLPDMWHPVRKRVMNAATLLLICVVVSETFLWVLTNSGLVVLTFGTICFSVLVWLAMSLDKITEKIIRSENGTLHKIFIPQISQSE